MACPGTCVLQQKTFGGTEKLRDLQQDTGLEPSHVGFTKDFEGLDLPTDLEMVCDGHWVYQLHPAAIENHSLARTRARTAGIPSEFTIHFRRHFLLAELGLKSRLGFRAQWVMMLMMLLVDHVPGSKIDNFCWSHHFLLVP